MLLRSAAIYCLLLLLPYAGWGQCDGNLGENIFPDGDFGSGTANVLSPDPKIAPGFSYVAFPPPIDGAYTVTNNTALWANIFGAWRLFGDNSDDPNGYMMLVNASYSPGLFYEQTVTGLCENTRYQFSADVTNVLKRGSNQLLPNVSFLLDDEEYITTGFLPEDELWKTYGFSFTTRPGQTSVKLALRNNAPGGIGNDLAIDNISFRACGPEALILPAAVADICEDGDPIVLTATINGDQFPTPALQWQTSPDGGETWEDLPGENGSSYVHDLRGSGLYLYRYLVANSPANLANDKCHIISNVKQINVIPKNYAVVDTLCAGLTFAVGDRDYGRTGVYVDTLVNAIGCDSIVQLDLTIVPDPGLRGIFSLTQPSCSYLPDGSVRLDTILNGTAPYRYTFAGQPRQAGETVPSLTEASYPYRIQDRYGCAREDSVRLVSPNPFSVNLGPDLEMVLGESATIPVRATQPVTAYEWSPAELISCDSLCSSVDVLPPHTVMLGLTATSDDGCLAMDSVLLRVIDERLVFIPTAFSPNDDGENDRFTVFGSVPNVQGIVSLRIFDRWGGEVFSAGELLANDEQSGWDGRVGDGRQAPVGTYVYSADVLFLDGVTQTFAGTVTLVR